MGSLRPILVRFGRRDYKYLAFGLLLLNMNSPFLVVVVLISWLELTCGHTRGFDMISYFDAYMDAGSRCGPHTLTGWNVRYDRYWTPNLKTGTKGTSQFNAGTGIFTAPTLIRYDWGETDAASSKTTQGLYRCCASARCKKGGYCDFTLVDQDGNVIGAFGTRLSPSDWSTHEVCVNERFATGDTLKVVLNSGAGSDCWEETGWRYVRFSCNLASVS